MPLDLDEARELLSVSLRGRIGEEQLLEELHRDARGNPSKLLRLAETRPPILVHDRHRTDEPRTTPHWQPSEPHLPAKRVTMPDDPADEPKGNIESLGFARRRGPDEYTPTRSRATAHPR